MSRLSRWLARGARTRWHQPVPGADEALEVAGWRKPPAAGTTQPPRVAPLPGPRRTLTVHFYDDGHSEVLFHRDRRRLVIPGEPEPGVDLSDAALRRFLDEQR